MTIDEAIALANTRLKSAKIRIAIERRGDRLWLRGTLPPKPHREAIKKYKGNYSASRVDPRFLPTDSAIALWRSTISNPAWQWVAGMLAVYGLRNHEVFRLDLKDFPVIRVLG
jgi:integrase